MKYDKQELIEYLKTVELFYRTNPYSDLEYYNLNPIIVDELVEYIIAKLNTRGPVIQIFKKIYFHVGHVFIKYGTIGQLYRFPLSFRPEHLIRI